MPILYDIDKQLMDIAKEFEKKFPKQAQVRPQGISPIDPNAPVQEAPAKEESIQDVMKRNAPASNDPKPADTKINALAAKLLSNLENEVSSVFTKDLKNLRSFIEFCLDQRKVDEAGNRLVHYSDKNTIGSNYLGKEFADLPDATQDLYVEYKDAEANYYVNREGLIEYVSSLQNEARSDDNKVGEVMLGKIIDEANAKLKLGIDKNNPKAPNGTAPKNSKDPKDPNGAHANQQPEATNQSAEVKKAQDLLEKNTFDKLAKKGPLFGDELDLENIRLFAQLVKASTEQPYFTTWLMYRYGYPPDASETKSSIDARKSEVVRSCDELISNINKMRADWLNTLIIPAANVAVGVGEGFVQNFNTLMLPGRQTAAYVAEVLNFCRRMVDAVPYLLGTVTQKADYLADQKSIAATWKENLGRAYQSANIARNQDARKLLK